jgi:hypothetical protein
VSTFAGLETHQDDVKPLTGGFNALGLFQVSEGSEVSIRIHDGVEQKAQVYSLTPNESSVKSAEETQDILSALWKSRRPKDCRIFFQASHLCHLNGAGE